MHYLRSEDAVRVVCALKPLTFGMRAVVAQCGDPALGLYIVKSGECRFVAPSTTTNGGCDTAAIEAAAIGPRDTFGEEALRRDRRGARATIDHSFTVLSARSSTELLLLPRRDALRMLGARCRSILTLLADARIERLGARSHKTQSTRRLAMRHAAEQFAQHAPQYRMASAREALPALDLSRFIDAPETRVAPLSLDRRSALRCRCKALCDDEFAAFRARYNRKANGDEEASLRLQGVLRASSDADDATSGMASSSCFALPQLHPRPAATVQHVGALGRRRGRSF